MNQHPADQSALRHLPSVHQLVESLEPAAAARFPRALAVAEARLLLSETRRASRDARSAAAASSGPEHLADELLRRLEALAAPSLRRVINATGVVLHTNLGRAPLAALPPAEGYSNLEYDIGRGRRGKRDVHCGLLLARLLGAPAIAVNNNAAAVFLALNELAAGAEAIVSRGELIEIGDGFRIPDIMARSGAVLREVGTTNRTTVDDYRSAINPRTRVILRVHASNFRIEGFTARPSLDDLVALGRSASIPVYEDLGSGCLVDLGGAVADEPRPQASLAAGADLVSFSGDKLLGGPQAGILAGDETLVARLRRNPLFRALRLDKLILGSLESTLRFALLQQWDRIPALRMIRTPAEQIRPRAERVAAQLPQGFASVEPALSVIGGGATPERSLDTFVIAIAPWASLSEVAMERCLRLGDPPVIARIEAGRLIIDLRTVFEEEEGPLVKALEALAAGGNQDRSR
jgi:L-seryl-tRNA(Ser) seleniumtransferase